MSGRFLRDGFATTVEMSGYPNVKLFVKSVTPFGISSGGPIDVDHMGLARIRGKAPKQKVDITPMTMEVSFAVAALEDMLAMVGEEQTFTSTYHDGDGDSFIGYVDEFIRGEHVEGQQPTATVTIQPTCLDIDDDTEALPEYIVATT